VTAGNLQAAVEGYDLTQELVGGDATRASPPKEISSREEDMWKVT